MLPSDAEVRQLPSIVKGLGPKSNAYSSKRDLNFSINRFTGGGKVFVAQLYH